MDASRACGALDAWGLGPAGAVPQLLRGVVVFDCANSNYRKHAKGSVSALVSLGVTLPIAIQGSEAQGVRFEAFNT